MIDCMSCLVRLAQDFPTNGGVHMDRRGITHATVRWAREVVFICTLDYRADLGTEEWFVTDSTVRV